MQNINESGIKLSNHAVKLLVSIKETEYFNEIGFDDVEKAYKAFKHLDNTQLLLSSGAVVNIVEEVEYKVVPATLN